MRITCETVFRNRGVQVLWQGHDPPRAVHMRSGDSQIVSSAFKGDNASRFVHELPLARSHALAQLAQLEELLAQGRTTSGDASMLADPHLAAAIAAEFAVSGASDGARCCEPRIDPRVATQVPSTKGSL